MSSSGAKGSSSTAFLNKLWKIVNDEVTDNLIQWSPNGSSFIIFDQGRFSQELLPKYFKHNNMASFVRQLNLYGFRKITSIEAGGLMIDKGEIEFSHSKFIKDHPNLLEQIKRKSQGPTRAVATTEESGNINEILREVQHLRKNQDVMNSKINSMKKENDIIWRQYSSIHAKLMKQKTVIEKLVHFLLSLVKSPGQHMSTKWKFNHRALEGGENSASNNIGSQNMSLEYESPGLLSITGPVIHEVTHLDEGDQAACLEKVFEIQDNTNSVPVKSANSGSKAHEYNSKQEVLESIVLEDNWLESSDSALHNPDESLISVGSANYDNTKIEDNEFDSFREQLISSLTTGSHTIPSNREEVITVQSPNGTFLHTDSPPLSPDILQGVNPSEVNPNIIVNVKRENIPPIFTAPSNDVSRTRGNSNVFKAGGGKYPKYSKYTQPTQYPIPRKGNTLAAANVSTNENDSPDFFTAWDNSGLNVAASDSITVDMPHASKVFVPSKGKNWPKNGVENYGKLPPNQRQRIGKKLPGENMVSSTISSSSQNRENRETYRNFDVAVPDKHINSYLNDTQLSLDNLKDLLSAGNLNIDASALQSIFTADEEQQLAAHFDPLINDSGILGNEMSVYNPSLYDIPAEADDDNFSFASLVGREEDEESISPTKKFKMDPPFKKKDDDEDGITTPQPKPHPFFK